MQDRPVNSHNAKGPSLIALACVALTLAVVPWVFSAASKSLGARNNDVRQWLPRGFSETRRYDWFLQKFESEEFVLVSWEGASAEDPRLEALSAALQPWLAIEDGPISHERDMEERSEWFRKLVTGPQLQARLQAEPFELSEAQAKQRLTGSLFGADGNTTGLLAFLSPTGQTSRHEVIDTITDAATQVGVPHDLLRLGGPTVDSVALDQESERSRFLLTMVSLALGSVAAWRCLRAPMLMALVLLTSIFCGAISLAWLQVWGDQLNLMMVTMPTLVYVLTISGAIHITHYFQSSVREGGPTGAARRTLKAGWLPCTLTALTTAIGLGSLSVSHVQPVRLFGFYSGLGVISSLPVVLFFVPATLSLLVWWQPSYPVEWRQAHGAHPAVWSVLLRPLSRFSLRWHMPITACGVVVLLVGIGGTMRLQTSVKLTNFFSPESRVIADYRWLEQNLSSLVPIEIVLRIPEQTGLRLIDRLRLTSEVQAAVAALPHVDGALSAATFAPPVSVGGGALQTMRRAATNRRLEAERQSLMKSGYLETECGYELWRISARVAALNDLDYGEFVAQLPAVVQPVIDDFITAQAADQPLSIEPVYTGVMPLIYKAQRVLLRDLASSFLLAFGIIAVVMLALMKGLLAGLVSMLPNTFPAIVVFGGMGWSGQLCDIGAVITASVALGIAVDDTIHFMTWFRRGLAAGKSRWRAIIMSYRKCGIAMLQTTIICGMGMVGFAFSEFAPTSRFAMLMTTLLFAALVGDLIFLPALLASPIGRLFAIRPATDRPRSSTWTLVSTRARISGS